MEIVQIHNNRFRRTGKNRWVTKWRFRGVFGEFLVFLPCFWPFCGHFWQNVQSMPTVDLNLRNRRHADASFFDRSSQFSHNRAAVSAFAIQISLWLPPPARRRLPAANRAARIHDSLGFEHGSSGYRGVFEGAAPPGGAEEGPSRLFWRRPRRWRNYPFASDGQFLHAGQRRYRITALSRSAPCLMTNVAVVPPRGTGFNSRGAVDGESGGTRRRPRSRVRRPGRELTEPAGCGGAVLPTLLLVGARRGGRRARRRQHGRDAARNQLYPINGYGRAPPRGRAHRRAMRGEKVCLIESLK